jgi:rod shape determining protein RodA
MPIAKYFAKIDFLIFIPALLLSCFGLLIIYSVSFESDPSFFYRQLVFLIFSITLFLIVSQISFKTIIHFSSIFYLLLLVLLIATDVFGSEVQGSVRWLDLGLVKLQASELAKPIIVLALSSFFAKYSPKEIKNFLFSGILVIIPALLILKQPDFGSFFMLVLIWSFVVFISGTNIIYLLSLIVGSIVALPIFWNFLAGYQKTRILTFFNPNMDVQGASYNVIQAIIAFGSGQLVGRGLGRGTQSHLNFLPAERTDFIFASTGEELGFLGISIIVVLFVFLVYRLVVYARAAKRIEEGIFIFGTAFAIFVQFFINSAVNMGILPATGITLPFVSYGGSSIVSMFLFLALVQSIINQKKEKTDTVLTS